MSDVVASISRLVKSARRLRDAADELDQLDLKSQIVDEISTLQEIRDEMTDGSSDQGDSHVVIESSTDESGSSVILASDSVLGIVKPSGKEETYSFSAVQNEEPEPPATDEAEAGSANGTPQGLTAAEQRAVIEMKISDLEQLEQAATRRMNDVTTAEQKKIKAKATHAGRDAGKAGKELQRYVYGAMKLTPEQKTQIQSIRKDLHSIREAIVNERESLESLNAVES